MLARSHPAQIVEYRFPASLQEGEERVEVEVGEGWGLAEVTADFFFLLFLSPPAFAKEKQLSLKYTMLAQTNT